MELQSSHTIDPFAGINRPPCGRTGNGRWLEKKKKSFASKKAAADWWCLNSSQVAGWLCTLKNEAYCSFVDTKLCRSIFSSRNVCVCVCVNGMFLCARVRHPPQNRRVPLPHDASDPLTTLVVFCLHTNDIFRKKKNSKFLLVRWLAIRCWDSRADLLVVIRFFFFAFCADGIDALKGCGCCRSWRRAVSVAEIKSLSHFLRAASVAAVGNEA